MTVGQQVASSAARPGASPSRPIRLMLFTDSFVHGGTERQLVQVLRQIDRDRYDVMVGCLKKRGPFLPDVEALGIPIFEFPINSLYGLKTTQRFRELIRFFHAQRVDLVHTFDFYTNSFAATAARLAKVPVVLTSLREIVTQRRRSHRWITHVSCRAAHAVVANSRAAGESIFSHGRNDRLEIVWNGLELDRYSSRQSRAEMRSQLGIAESDLLVGVLAALRPEKGHDLFLYAAATVAKRVSRAKFVLIGDGPERPRLEALVKELSISDRVLFLGDRSDVPECLAMLDLAVSPSASESLSNAILEEMAMGLPVVATRTGGTPEIVREGENGYLVSCGDSGAMADRISVLLENSDLRMRMATSARSLVEQEFTAERMWGRLDEVYRKMLRAKLPVARVMHVANFPPPVCGWSIHTLHVHQSLRERGADSHVIDLSPNRRVQRDGCIPVFGGFDYLRKLWRATRGGYTFYVHVNGDSWKRYALSLMAILMGRVMGKPSVLAFHAGPKQALFPRSSGFWYHGFKLLFDASGQIVCDDEPVKDVIARYVPAEKVHAIPPFTPQNVNEKLPVPLPDSVEAFLARRSPVIFSYTLFRPEFEMEMVFRAFAQLKQNHPNVGLLIAGPNEVPLEFQLRMQQLGILDSVLVAGNLPHDQFMTAVLRSSFCLRSHLRDGVCASVLESLRLGVPVVAAEDGIRPRSVVTYAPGNAEELEKTLDMVLRNIDSFRAQVVRPDLENGLAREVDLLLKAGAVTAK